MSTRARRYRAQARSHRRIYKALSDHFWRVSSHDADFQRKFTGILQYNLCAGKGYLAGIDLGSPAGDRSVVCIMSRVGGGTYLEERIIYPE